MSQRKRMNRAFAMLFLLAAVLSVAGLASTPISASASEYMVPMRDGVELATSVYLPEGDGPWPVVLLRTPYGKDGQLVQILQPNRYTNQGFAFVAQDCRGKYKSEGEYRPFEDDRDDGYDTVDWVAKQPWCNGKVGMTGASALGITTLLAAIANHDALVAGFVIVAPESFWDEATFIGGVFKEADTTNWLRGQNAADQIPQHKARLEEAAQEQELDIKPNRHQISIPIYHVGGWYDIFAVGTQGNFSFLHNEGAEGARGRQKLMMGPYGHGGLKGDLRYRGGGGLLSGLAEEMRWFEHHLKGVDNGIMDEPPVKYYQMAAARKSGASEKNGWRTAENWPPESEALRLYLTNNPGLSPEKPQDQQAATTYAFDPADPVKTVGGPNLTLDIGPLDQREISGRQDYLRFETEPLAEDISIAGPIVLELYVSTDAPDTDIMAKLVDVYPDGYEALLTDAALRLRYRNGRTSDAVQMMKPGQVERIEIPLGSLANTFEAGHRIAVHVTSSNYPRFEVNPNTGDPIGQNTSKPRIANNTVHHDAVHASALVLPVVD